MSDRLGGSHPLTRLVPDSASRYGESASPEVEQWAHDTLGDLQFYDRTRRRVVTRVTEARQIRQTYESGVIVSGGLYRDDRPVAAWDVVVTIHNNGTVTATIHRLNIRTVLQGQGIGSGWVRELEQALRGVGVTRIDLSDASEDEEGRSFWEHIGYTPEPGSWSRREKRL